MAGVVGSPNEASGSTTSVRTRQVLSETAALAAVPLLAYALTFSYEAGFVGYYHLPLWIIDLELSRIFVVLAGLLSVLTLVYWLVFLVPAKVRNLYPLVMALFPPAAILAVLVLFVVIGHGWIVWALLVPVLSILFFTVLIRSAI